MVQYPEVKAEGCEVVELIESDILCVCFSGESTFLVIQSLTYTYIARSPLIPKEKQRSRHSGEKHVSQD